MTELIEALGVQHAFLSALTVAALCASWAVRSQRAFILYMTGMVLFYDAQRVLAEDPTSNAITVLALMLLAASVWWRLTECKSEGQAHQAAHRAALRWQLIGLASIGAYALTTPTCTDLLGLSSETLPRWVVPWQALIGIIWLVGTLPMWRIDQLRRHHPVMPPQRAIAQASEVGVALALAVSLVFPANYLAAQYDVEWDFSYFRVTDPGSSTEALVANLDEPVEIVLFYPPGNEVKERLLGYFERLSQAAEGKLSYRVADQPMQPELAEELSVKNNGYIVIRKGDTHEKFKVDTELKKARRNLKKLDGEFQKYLLKLAKGKRVAYLLTGHGEASSKDENPFFKLGDFQKILKAQNYDLKDFGLTNGSTDAVPDDAALVVLAAPEKKLFPEEVATLKRYVDAGGALLVYVDPGREPVGPLMAHLGLQIGEHPLANAKQHARTTGGIVDRGNLITNRFGSHATVATLSKFSSQAVVVMVSARAISETDAASLPGTAKYTPLIRSLENTWAETEGDFEQSDAETGAVSILAMAIEGPKSNPYRAVVVGDVSVISDVTLQSSKGNVQFALDTTRWLIGEEDLAGDINNEEDVMIQHTKEGDVLWFYSVIFGAPLSVLLFGALALARRKR
jgi:hypothetical protein